MTAVHHKGNAHVQGNLTPMIDMIFLLIVFFVLVSRIVDRERVEMNLPQPVDAATVRIGEDQRVIINVLPGQRGTARGYRVGGDDFGADDAGIAAMTQHLESVYRMKPKVNINVRADRGTHYQHVEPVIQAISTAARNAGAPAATARVNLVVIQQSP